MNSRSDFASQFMLVLCSFALTTGCGSWAIDSVMKNAADDIAGRLRAESRRPTREEE